MAIRLIIGLRNPGSTYAETRHNAGEWLVKRLAHMYSASFKMEKKLQAELATIVTDDLTCKLLLPLTFMNHSGISIQLTRQFYHFQTDEILVVHDELDLPCGRIKLKTGGGPGGHNGLRSVISHLGNADFHRLRIGIDHPGHRDRVLNYVLGKPSTADRALILTAIERAIAVIPTAVSGNIAAAMNQLNG